MWPWYAGKWRARGLQLACQQSPRESPAWGLPQLRGALGPYCGSVIGPAGTGSGLTGVPLSRPRATSCDLLPVPAELLGGGLTRLARVRAYATGPQWLSGEARPPGLTGRTPSCSSHHWPSVVVLLGKYIAFEETSGGDCDHPYSYAATSVHLLPDAAARSFTGWFLWL
jgi:hypothetical protein